MKKGNCELSVSGCGNPAYNIYSWNNPCSDWHKNVMCIPNLLKGILWGNEHKKGLIPRVEELEQKAILATTNITNITLNVTNVEETVNNIEQNITNVLEVVNNFQENITEIQEYVTNIENVIQAGIKPMVVMTTEQYEQLVENDNISDNTLYFLYESEELNTPDTPTDEDVQGIVLPVNGTVNNGILTVEGTVLDGILYI